MDNAWIKKRRITFIIFVIQYFIDALQVSIGYVTAWIYINEIAGDSPYLNLYYGLLHGAIYLPTILFSNLVSYIADETRNVKHCLLFGNFIAMIENILYIMPGSVWYPIIGRFFAGYGQLMRPIIIGEVFRAYDEDDTLLRKLKILRVVYGMGKAAAPAIALIFLNIKIWIGPIYLRYANMPGVFLFMMIFLIEILIICFVSDLSKEFDFKEHRMNIHGTNRNISSGIETAYDRSYSVINFLSQALKIFDVHLLFLTNYVRSVITVIIFLQIPTIVISDLDYSESIINYIVFAQLVLTIVIITLLYMANINHVDGGILAMLGMILSMGMLFVVSNNLSFASNFIILVISWTMVEVNIINMNIYCSIGLGQIISSKYQSFLDSIRMQTGHIGHINGCLLEAFALEHPYSVFISLIIINVLLIIITVTRRSSFLNPVIKVT